ncbi:MAG: seg [candidate division WS6 bacterium 34_10]|jgi:membrane-bound ClpP family serine protease|uniref:Seg n=1 Tax=candidate division WS6 bacterium 34_10 TaxID=1641389 RepID=A0A101HGV4_9BACT|nr:MAG: seg [candidate division WS6 bacterium 34_10]
MTKNPFYNALAALGYIVLIVSTMTLLSTYQSNFDEFIMPIIMLSLFTLSAAVMGYIFFYQPVMLFLDNKKDEAVKLFLKSIGIFGVITLTISLIYFLFTIN